MAGLKVRGECPVCRHAVETEAPKGRATWRGDCPVEGCKGRIVATRIKAPATSPASKPAAGGQPGPDAGKPVATPAKTTTARRGRRVVKVEGYERAVPAAPRAAAGTRTPKPAKRPGAADGGAPKPPGGADGTEPAHPQPVRSDRSEDGRHHSHPAGRYGFDLW